MSNPQFPNTPTNTPIIYGILTCTTGDQSNQVSSNDGSGQPMLIQGPVGQPWVAPNYVTNGPYYSYPTTNTTPVYTTCPGQMQTPTTMYPTQPNMQYQPMMQCPTAVQCQPATATNYQWQRPSAQLYCTFQPIDTRMDVDTSFSQPKQQTLTFHSNTGTSTTDIPTTQTPRVSTFVEVGANGSDGNPQEKMLSDEDEGACLTSQTIPINITVRLRPDPKHDKDVSGSDSGAKTSGTSTGEAAATQSETQGERKRSPEEEFCVVANKDDTSSAENNTDGRSNQKQPNKKPSMTSEATDTADITPEMKSQGTETPGATIEPTSSTSKTDEVDKRASSLQEEIRDSFEDMMERQLDEIDKDGQINQDPTNKSPGMTSNGTDTAHVATDPTPSTDGTDQESQELRNPSASLPIEFSVEKWAKQYRP